MITFDKAFEVVMNSVFETEIESVPFTESAGRILSEDISSDIYMPPFNRSAVDGYACRMSDLQNDLEVLEIISAGMVPLRAPGRDQCSKIMTGAIVPDSCDIVFMIEDSVILPNGKVRFTGKDPKINISFKGEDVRPGDIVLRKGKYLKPQDIAVLASVGRTFVRVWKKPRVGIISTGNELVEPSVSPDISKIRNSNAYQLLSQVERAGGLSRYYGIAPDIEKITNEMVQKAIEENDVVLITGGVSMGDFDFIPSVLEQSGVKILFDQVNVQPGKPTTFGIHAKAVVFALPGNPVSSFIQFETLVRPFLSRMMGYKLTEAEMKLPLAVTYERKSTSRQGWVPVLITENDEVMPVEFHGSAHISALSEADGIIVIKEGIKKIEKGEIVSVRQF